MALPILILVEPDARVELSDKPTAFGLRPGGVFIVCLTGEAYNPRDRGSNRKSSLRFICPGELAADLRRCDIESSRSEFCFRRKAWLIITTAGL